MDGVMEGRREGGMRVCEGEKRRASGSPVRTRLRLMASLVHSTPTAVHVIDSCCVWSSLSRHACRFKCLPSLALTHMLTHTHSAHTVLIGLVQPFTLPFFFLLKIH